MIWVGGRDNCSQTRETTPKPSMALLQENESASFQLSLSNVSLSKSHGHFNPIALKTVKTP